MEEGSAAWECAGQEAGARAAGMRPSAIAVGCMNFHGILDIGKMSEELTRGIEGIREKGCVTYHAGHHHQFHSDRFAVWPMTWFWRVARLEMCKPGVVTL